MTSRYSSGLRSLLLLWLLILLSTSDVESPIGCDLTPKVDKLRDFLYFVVTDSRLSILFHDLRISNVDVETYLAVEVYQVGCFPWIFWKRYAMSAMSPKKSRSSRDKCPKQSPVVLICCLFSSSPSQYTSQKVLEIVNIPVTPVCSEKLSVRLVPHNYLARKS